MKFRTNDDTATVFEGDDAREIVRQMRDSGWKEYDRKREYMSDVAERVAAMTGTKIDAGDAESFLRGLEEAGLIEQV